MIITEYQVKVEGFLLVFRDNFLFRLQRLFYLSVRVEIVGLSQGWLIINSHAYITTLLFLMHFFIIIRIFQSWLMLLGSGLIPNSPGRLSNRRLYSAKSQTFPKL